MLLRHSRRVSDGAICLLIFIMLVYTPDDTRILAVLLSSAAASRCRRFFMLSYAY